MTYNCLDHKIQNLVSIILFDITKTCESLKSEILFNNRLSKLTEMKVLSLCIDLAFLDKYRRRNETFFDVTAAPLDNSLLNKVS
jgi:hypothetical protein